MSGWGRHRTAQQKAAARRRDPFGGRPAQIAPLRRVPPVRCARDGCEDTELAHRDSGCTRCACVGWVEP